MNPGCNGFGVLQDLIHRKHREEEVAEKSRGNAGITCRSRAFVPRELAKISNVISTLPLWNTTHYTTATGLPIIPFYHNPTNDLRYLWILTWITTFLFLLRQSRLNRSFSNLVDDDYLTMAWKKAIEVKVLVNGTPAQEYNDDEGESGGSPTVTKYIEAISGAEFAVQYELKRSLRFKSELLYIEIYIDGKSLDGELIERAAFEQNPRGYTRSLDGITRSYGETWSLEKFKFSEIKISKSIYSNDIPSTRHNLT